MSANEVMNSVEATTASVRNGRFPLSRPLNLVTEVYVFGSYARGAAEPKDLDVVMMMLCSNESHFINGAVIQADDGFAI